MATKSRKPRQTSAAKKSKSGPVRLTPDKLRWRCTMSHLGITSTDDVEPSKGIIGQDRALRALHVGLEMQHYGYNIFVTGLSGTGRTTTITRLLKECVRQPVDLTDKCYVHNFRNTDCPTLIVLPAGKGISFKKDMERFVNELLTGIPAVFESRRYRDQRKNTIEHFHDRQKTVLREFERRVREKGFEVVQTQAGATMRPEIAWVIDGTPVGLDHLHAKVDSGDMSEEEFKSIIARQTELESQMDVVMREMRNIERKAKSSVESLNTRVIVPIVGELLDELREKYGTPEVNGYLDDVKGRVLENLTRFGPKEEQTPQSILGLPVQKEDDDFREFQVNVVVDNGNDKCPPVIIEKNPRYKNLFGTIERTVDRNGVWRSDFTHIKAGSILRADGGYLVVNAMDALIEPGVWTTLKRVLRNRQIEIQPPESGLFGASSALKPEPVNLNVKVIMIGDAYVYNLLYQMDDDFKKVFKIRSEFDVVMPNNEKTRGSYLAFVKRLCDEEGLMAFNPGGVAEVVEHGVRLAGNQKRLATRFAEIADVIREANYWASMEKAVEVTRAHVRKAVEEKIERVKMIEEKIQEMITEGTILISTEDAVVGQVNGLAVYQVPGHAFGKPSRITAKTAMGRAGIINIERESEMSGPTHNKGVLILSGYLRYMYAQDKPLVLSASIAFEQSYSGVDGDSASSTEVYALLSSLANIPVRQDLAVTGSVNQHGEIQPIGGVNQKIEGFFDVCRARGLSGTQGVLIPVQNIPDLMLRHDVVEAVEKKQFHIYAVKSVDEGIELLTGITAGKQSGKGTFTPGSVHARVNATLTKYAKNQKKFGGG